MSYQLIVFDGQLDRLPDLRLAFPRYGAWSEIWKLGAEMKRLDPGPNLRVARDLSACLALLCKTFSCYSGPGVKSTPLEKQTRALLLQAKEDP